MPLKLNSTGGGSITLDTPSTAGTYTVTVPASNQTLGITSGTVVASTSGTSIDFTGIPSWVKRITVMFDGVSTNGTSGIEIRLGDSGGIENTGYASACARFSSTGSATAGSTSGFNIEINAAAYVASGSLLLSKLNGNTWTSSGSFGYNTGVNLLYTTAGSKTLSDVLTQVRVATTNGTDTFDAGSINIMYEG